MVIGSLVVRMETMVVLVDERDREIGTAEKMRVHSEGMLHRAFSVFVFDDSGRLLIQRRADGKYHSGGLWSNTCCGHSQHGEDVRVTAERRLREEMGFVCPLVHCLGFVYRAALDNGLVEHEFDHVLMGRFQGDPIADPHEVGAWRWETPETIRQELGIDDGAYTAWFPLAFDRLSQFLGADAGSALAPRSTRTGAAR
jgi:isopentenyl-diphosphate delta-isomerase